MPDRRLLCLIQLPPPIHGTTVINAQVANSDLLRSHFDVEVLPLNFADSVNDIGRPSLKKLGQALSIAATLTKKLAKTRPDAVYFTVAPTGGAFFRDCLYVAIIKSFGTQRIYHVHGKGISDVTDRAWRRLLYRWFFRGARVIQLSPLLDYDIEGIADRDGVKYVANGIAPHERTDTRRERSATEPVRFLYVSNITRDKGPLVLVEALGLLRARGAKFEAVFAGADAGDGSLAELETRVRELDLEQVVRYVGPTYGEAKNELLRTSDVFVFPTFYRQEAFPLVILEAMQFGLPVVSTFEGAIPEIVIEGETGLLVPQRNPEQLATALEKLLGSRELIAKMGSAGRQRFAENYTARHLEERLVEALSGWM